MTEIERVKKRMRDVAGLSRADRGEYQEIDLYALARWHLAELRKARGRAIGYVAVMTRRGRAPQVTSALGKRGDWDFGDQLDSDDGARQHHVARVVLVPRRQKVKPA